MLLVKVLPAIPIVWMWNSRWSSWSAWAA